MPASWKMTATFHRTQESKQELFAGKAKR
jgi:hypothetical protein